MKIHKLQSGRSGRMAQICEWLASFALLLLPVFFTLFCSVLFCVWYFGVASNWLIVVTAVLILCMGLTAGIFGIASAAAPAGVDLLGARETPIFGFPLASWSGAAANSPAENSLHPARQRSNNPTCEQAKFQANPSCVYCEQRQDCAVWKPFKLDGK